MLFYTAPSLSLLPPPPPSRFSVYSNMRGRIPDKWSMRILWTCAVGSGIGLYMVVVERQLQNRERMAAEGLQSIASDLGSGRDV